MSRDHDRTVAVAALRAALPYLRLFQGRVFVIKAGGDAFARPERTRALMEQIGILHRVGIRVVLVHGGGPQTTAMAEELSIPVEMKEGRRVTCDRTLDVSVMVLNGALNTDIVAKARALHVPCVGVSGVDGGLVRARRRPPRKLDSGEEVDYGHVGDIVSVDVKALERLLDDGFVPVVSPLSADDDGAILNINADVVAAALAREMQAEKLIVLTSAPGVLARSDDPDSLVSYTDVKGLNALHEQGSLAGGMLPKVSAIKDALYGGVHRVHVISHKGADSLLLEVFTNEGSGTLVVMDMSDLRPEEQQAQSRVEQLLDGGA